MVGVDGLRAVCPVVSARSQVYCDAVQVGEDALFLRVTGKKGQGQKGYAETDGNKQDAGSFFWVHTGE